MIGSASAWHSYGLTHDSMLPQPERAIAAATNMLVLATAHSLQPTAFMISSLFQQRPNLIQILAFVARLVALVQVAHVAFAIDEHGARHRLHIVHRADLALAIEQHRERYRRLAQPVLDVF